MEISLINVNLSYKRVTFLGFSGICLCVLFFESNQLEHWPGGSVLERCPEHQKVLGLDSWSGHIPRLLVQCTVGAYMEGD